MEKLKIEGIIVHAFPFKDHDQILSLFTQDEGLIKLCVKGAYKKDKHKGSSTNPLNIVEAIYTPGRGEISSCYEISVLDHQLTLRKDFSILTAACDMLQAVFQTQQPGKAAPELYQLLLFYLKKLPNTENVLTLSTSFRLKLLRYEGLINEEILFKTDAETYKLLQALTLSRDFSLLAPLAVNPLLAEQVNDFFAQCINSC